MKRSLLFTSIPVAASLAASPVLADSPAATPGYPEPVVQWGVQKDETCEDIAKAVYGSAKHAALVLRYNRVDCTRGKKLKEGATLVLPASVTSLPTARLRSMNPDVKARPSGGSWGPAAPGLALSSNAGVNTLDNGRADIEFIDRTRVFLASNTLVIIYGTASQSAVSKTPPPSVEVQAGEVKAGLAALRGETVEVAVKGGGRVSASSRETIVERKGERTTVGVYDGKAAVSSGGKTVNVPLNFGTRFTGSGAPSAPRPLPPAPTFESATAPLVLASSAGGTIRADWSAVKDAKSYRVEIARDDTFRDLVAREEVDGKVRSFRAEKMPPGRYFVGVRAIDTEEYIGVAATRAVDVIELDVSAQGATLGDKELVANPYATIGFKTGTKLDLALDDGPFGPVPGSIDLLKRAPAKMRFRPQGAAAPYEVTVRYTEVSAVVTSALAKDGKTATIDVAFKGLDGIDIAGRVAPTLRTNDGQTAGSAALVAKDGRFVATVAAPPPGGSLRVDVLDGRGAILGTGEVAAPKPEAPAANAPATSEPVPPRIGLTTESWNPAPITGAPFWSPTARNAGSIGAQIQVAGAGAGTRVQGSATGAFGPIGVDATFRSRLFGTRLGPTDIGDPEYDDGAWLGARWRAFRIGESALEGGVALRVGFPLSRFGPAARIEPALALGGVRGAYSFLANLGARIRVDDSFVPTPDFQGYLLLGGTVNANDWVRFGATLDGHVVHYESEDALFRGGLSLHAEVGTWIYGAASARLSPWDNDGGWFGNGPFSAQLAVGLRAP
ncbi:MAG: hypothetical protein U0441_07780 [Polyangiaceae bacterium]